MTVEVRLCVVCGLSFTVGLKDIKVTYLCLQVMMVSALKNIGIEAVWETMQEYQTTVEVYMHYCILEVCITDYTGSVHACTHTIIPLSCMWVAVSRGAGGSTQSSAATLAVGSLELAADGQVPAGAWHGGPRDSHGGQGGGWQHGPWHCR